MNLRISTFCKNKRKITRKQERVTRMKSTRLWCKTRTKAETRTRKIRTSRSDNGKSLAFYSTLSLTKVVKT